MWCYTAIIPALKRLMQGIMSSSQPGLYRQKKEKKRERERNPIQNKVL
jgi:hypothetical protein